MNTIIRQSDRRDAPRRVSATGRTALFLAVILAVLSCMAGCDIFDEILNEGKAPAFTAFSFSGQYGGFCSTTGSLDGQGYAGYYHSQTGRDLTSYAYHMRFISGAAGSVEPDTWNQRYFGYTVRCVR